MIPNGAVQILSARARQRRANAGSSALRDGKVSAQLHKDKSGASENLSQ